MCLVFLVRVLLGYPESAAKLGIALVQYVLCSSLKKVYVQVYLFCYIECVCINASLQAFYQCYFLEAYII